jgi:tRNA-specific 2-thiouridylase
VRRIAREAGLPVHAKKDSTGICFIGERPFRAFLARYLPRAPGSVRTPEGRVVGEHMGLSFYTIGQRSGLGIGGLKDSPETGGPWYVAGKDNTLNELIVVQGHDHPLLRTRVLRASDLAWVSGAPPPIDAEYAGKTRYRQPDASCRIAALREDSCTVEFAEPQWAVTPGQAIVLYRGEVCLGGGVIQ